MASGYGKPQGRDVGGEYSKSDYNPRYGLENYFAIEIWSSLRSEPAADAEQGLLRTEV